MVELLIGAAKRLFTESIASSLMLILNKGSPMIRSALVCSLSIAAKAASISLGVRASSSCNSTPSERAAAIISFTRCVWNTALAGLERTAKRLAFGTILLKQFELFGEENSGHTSGSRDIATW